MTDPNRAEDVLFSIYNIGVLDDQPPHIRDVFLINQQARVAALLAHGSKHGVVILPDGTLRGLKWHHEITVDEHYTGDPDAPGVCYRLTDPGEPT